MAAGVRRYLQIMDANSIGETVCPHVVLGDDEYARAFCKGHPSTIRFVISRGASPDVAEEIAQAAWVTGWEHRRELRNPALIGIWVNSIAKNMLFQHFEKTRRMDQLSTEGKAIPWETSSLEARRVLEKCCAADRQLLTTYYLEGHTAEEIAAETGVRPTTIRVRLLRIRRHLQLQVAGLASARGSRPRVLRAKTCTGRMPRVTAPMLQPQTRQQKEAA